MVIGLTGGIGSGKTTVAKLFLEKENIAVYFADKEAKQLMNTSVEIRDKIIVEFGGASYNTTGLNRNYISKIVFKDAEKLKKLNAIVHPAVKKHFQDFVFQNNNKSYILYENAILFESKSNLYCDIIISVFTPLQVRLQRITKRDNCTIEDAQDRIKNQWSEPKKLLQSHYVITNLDLESTKIQVNQIHNFLTKKL